jgi:hypothetical protein
VANSVSADMDLNLLPDWSETNLFLDACLKGSSNLVLCSMSRQESTDENSVLPLREELRSCQGMLDLLQNMPTVIFNAKISFRLAKYILHLERYALMIWSCSH